MVENRVDRRLAAILAGDIAGYSRMMGADEEGTLRQLSAHRKELIDPKIAEHRGRTVKTTGDGMLVEFASVVDAVRCAVDIQHGMSARNATVPVERRIQFRIGINVGDIISDSNDIYGDGVNVAARLEALCEPGGIFVSRGVHDQVRDKLSCGFEDLGEQTVKNIARPVGVFRWRPSAIETRAPVARLRTPIWRRGIIVAGAGACALASAAGIWWILEGGTRDSARESAPSSTQTRLQAQGRTAVAVLPFVNLNGDPTRDYFSDGLTEEVIGALGRFSALSVLSRNAVMPLKGKTAPAADTAKALGVLYLVEGTVRHADSRIRVSMQLADASGRLLWSEQFDGDTRDVIAVQEKIARRVVGVLAVRLTRAEQERTLKLQTENLEAYDFVLRGRAQLSTSTRRANVEARMQFQRAIALDSRYADAYVGLGISYLYAIDRGWVADPQESLTNAETAAREAIRLDDRNSRGHALLASLLVYREHFDQAKEASRRSIELNPSDAEGYWSLGRVLIWSSEIAAAIEALETGRAYDPVVDFDAFNLALAYYLADRPDDVIKYVEGRVGRQGQNVFTYVVLSMAYADLGKREEANAVVELARRRNPAIDPEVFGTLLRNPAHRAKIRAGLQKAGWL